MEKELLAGEILLHPVDTSVATADVDAELEKIEVLMKSYTCQLSTFDYAAAVISGIVAGAIDAFVINSKAPLFGKDISPIREQIEGIFKTIMDNQDSLKDSVDPVRFRKGEQEKPELFSRVEEIARQQPFLRPICSFFDQAWNCKLVSFEKDQLKFDLQKDSKEEQAFLLVTAAIIGILKWLTDLSKEQPEERQSNDSSGILEKICSLIRSSPVFSQVVKTMEEGEKHLAEEIENGRRKDMPGMGVEGCFYSFFSFLGLSPAFEGTGLKKAVEIMEKGKRLKLDEVPIVKALTHQTFPVLVNEILVRAIFFATRLADELSADKEIAEIDWQRVLPFGQRNIDRLIAVSSMTLSVADTADAAIHAALESTGNIALFATTFVTRFNYVAAGRAAFAIGKEISNEKAQAELIRQRQLLVQEKSEKEIEVLLRYQKQLEARVSEYLAEDLQVFLEGITCMDQGIAEKNSDLVIRGNVQIQRMLGREVQFTNQQEFDDLMDSDIPLKL